MKKLLWISCSLFAAACGDNADGKDVDAGAGIDSPPTVDAAIDSPPSTPFAVDLVYQPPISTMGPDQIQAVKAGPNNSWYLAGFAAQTAAGPKSIFVAQTTAMGPVTTFGNIPNSGVALTQFNTPTGAADEIDLALQSDGKIIVSFNIANTVDATDRDVAVIRLIAATGALDTTFGDQGITRINFSTKDLTIGNNAGFDSARGLTVDANNNIFVTAVAVSTTTPANTDFAIAKLSPNGALSDGTNGTTGWGDADSGKRFINTVINTTNHNATVRGVVALADGSVIAGGYVSGTALVPGNVPLWYKLDANGDLVTTFGGAGTGIFFDAVLARQTEVYNFALNADGSYVTTAGYGGNDPLIMRDDWISMKIDTTTGVRVPTWGGSTNGAKVFDVSADGMSSSNCRNAISLPGNKTLLVGSNAGASANNTPAQDAAFAVLDADGNLDTKYGTGINRLKFSATADQSDQLWAGAANGTKVLMAGWRGTSGMPQSAALNDDSFIVIFTIQP